jgi:hypothetical protein
MKPAGDRGCETHTSGEAAGLRAVSGGNAPPIFQAVEHTPCHVLHAAGLSVKGWQGAPPQTFAEPIRDAADNAPIFHPRLAAKSGRKV